MKAALLAAALALPGHPMAINHAQHAAQAYIATPRGGSGPAENLRVYRCKPHRRMTDCWASWSDSSITNNGVPQEADFRWLVHIQRRGRHPLCKFDGYRWATCYG